MPDFKVLGTNHTSFTVTSLDQTLAFFRDELGFRATEKMPRDQKMAENVTGVRGASITVAFVDLPGHRLEFIEYAGPADRGKVKARPCDVGFAHIALDVDNLDAALACAGRYGFKALGPVQISDKGPNKGRKIVYTTNADGITVEFIQPQPK
jgi:catechol 2,3-dioxygenase-like lactoylglutathione lyase family enzyme